MDIDFEKARELEKEMGVLFKKQMEVLRPVLDTMGNVSKEILDKWINDELPPEFVRSEVRFERIRRFGPRKRQEDIV